MNCIDKQLFRNYDSYCEIKTNENIRYLNNLVELNYINIQDNSLSLTKAGYDYFMRKCSVDNTDFRYDNFAPIEIQRMIYETFFKNKTGVNTVEKFIKANLAV